MRKFRWLLLPISGLLLGLSLICSPLSFLVWFAPIPAFLFLYTEEKKKRFIRRYGEGLLFSMPFYLTCYYWFFHFRQLEFLGMSAGEKTALAVFCWVGLSLLQSLLQALVFPLFACFSRLSFFKKKPFLTPLLAGGLFALDEWGLTLTWAGVPFVRVATSLVGQGILKNGAALFGSYFLTFTVMVVAAALAYLACHRAEWRKSAILVACLLFSLLISGIVGYISAKPENGESLVVAAVQGNVGSSDKWSVDCSLQTYKVYEKYTAEAAAAGAEFLVFPETFLPEQISENSSLGAYLQKLSKTYNVTIFAGGFGRQEGQETNNVFAVTPNGILPESYLKQRLVPFGEYVPYRELLMKVFPPLAEMGMLDDDLLAGEESKVIATENGSFGFLICFDSIYENLTLNSVRAGAEVICLPTNDSWFEGTAALRMHHSQAVLRAVESGRWIVRAADTGISSLISPTGASIEEQPEAEEGMALGTVYLKTEKTLYDCIGNLFIYLLIAVFLLLPLADFIYIKKKNIPR